MLGVRQNLAVAKVLTVLQAAQWLGIPVGTLRSRIAAGELRSAKVDGLETVLVDDLTKRLARGHQGQAGRPLVVSPGTRSRDRALEVEQRLCIQEARQDAETGIRSSTPARARLVCPHRCCAGLGSLHPPHTGRRPTAWTVVIEREVRGVLRRLVRVADQATTRRPGHRPTATRSERRDPLLQRDQDEQCGRFRRTVTGRIGSIRTRPREPLTRRAVRLPANSRVELLEFLARGMFDEIVGTEEGPQIEFKEQAYTLASPKGRRDLVADVASFANSRGGVIALGVRAVPDASTQREVAERVVGVSAASVNEQVYTDLIRAHVWPLVREVQVRYYDGTADGQSRHLVALNIEAQAEHDQPFIVDRVAEVGSGPDLPHAVGWPTREGDDTHWEHAARIQQLIAGGLRGSVTRPSVDAGTSDDELQSQLGLIVDQQDWQRWATYAIHAKPLDGAPAIADFYGEFRAEARSWPGLREGGFNLGLTYQHLDPVGSLLVKLSQRNSVVLGRSGIVTTAALGSPGFLGWAQHRHTPWEELDHVVINPYVLVEFTAESLRLAYGFVGARIRPRNWRLRIIGVHLLDRVPLRLRETVGPEPPWPHELHEARVNDLDVMLDGTGDSLADSFRVLVEIYGQGFGLGEGAIPFATDRRIDPAKF